MDIEDICSFFPLTEVQEDKLDKYKNNAYYRISILMKLINTLKQDPKSSEEAAMLFNRAKPLAEMFIESSKPEKTKTTK